jgi:hypothetical protein
MAKKSSSDNPLTRVFLFLGVVVLIFFYFYKNPGKLNSLTENPKFMDLAGSVKGATSSIDTGKIKTKLVDPPQILGATQDLAVGAGILEKDETLNTLANDITEKIKDLPKDQAKQIVRNTCQQIVDNIDSSY